MGRLGLLWAVALAAGFGFSCAYAMGLKVQPPVAAIPVVAFSQPMAETKKILEAQAPDLKPEVMNTVLIALECAKENNTIHNAVLAVIDYSLPSNEKRLWVFDLSKSKLLFHTYIAHGFNSGVLTADVFGNEMNDKSSSLGVIETQQAYNGRYGAALKLSGLEPNFNDNVYKRFVVMHGTWYVSEDFIKKYGRAGRSWGCPAVPLALVVQITEALKDGAFMVVYYPEKKWLDESTFLNCPSAKNENLIKPKPIENAAVLEKTRDPVVFVDVNNNNKLDENDPVLTVKADDYKRIFNSSPPLERMLRRQIKGSEYIVLSNDELKQMSQNNKKEMVYFIIPVVQSFHGYYGTEMKIIDYGKISAIEISPSGFIIHFDKKPPVILKSTDKFIRWIGL